MKCYCCEHREALISLSVKGFEYLVCEECKGHVEQAVDKLKFMSVMDALMIGGAERYTYHFDTQTWRVVREEGEDFGETD